MENGNEELRAMSRLMKRIQELQLSSEGKRAAARILMSRDLPKEEYLPRLLQVLGYLEQSSNEDEFLQKMDLGFPEEENGTENAE